MPDSRKEVFVDTNVLFSTFYGSVNAESIVQAHISGRIKFVISQKVLEELVRNIRNKEPQAMIPLRKFLQTFPPKIVKNPTLIDPEVKEFVHPKDQKIFQSTVNAKVSYFVTGNTKDYKVKNLKKAYKIEILTPKQAVKKLRL